MNSWKFNGMTGHLVRQVIIKTLKIKPNDLYKVVKSIDNNGMIKLHDGRIFELTMGYLGNKGG